MRRCVNGSCVAPTPFNIIVEDPSTSCLVGIGPTQAFNQAEAVSCVQQQYPGYKVGLPSGNYTFQVWCQGNQCRDTSNLLALSMNDAQACVQVQNPGCTVQQGFCRDCFPLENCRGQCVNTSSDSSNCGGCDQVCQSGYSCVNGGCESTS
jgi:hypothetical protein